MFDFISGKTKQAKVYFGGLQPGSRVCEAGFGSILKDPGPVLHPNRIYFLGLTFNGVCGTTLEQPRTPGLFLAIVNVSAREE